MSNIYYDPNTDQIKGGVVFGSWVYWHESGHRLLHNKFDFQHRKQHAQRLLMFAAVLFAVAEYNRYGAAALWFWWVLEFFDEAFAWCYAVYKKRSLNVHS